MDKYLINEEIQEIINENKALKQEVFILKKEVIVLKDEITGKQKTADNLARTNEALEETAYIICHQIRQPLGGTANYINFLEKKYRDILDDDGRLFINYALAGLETINNMIDTILEFSKYPLKINEITEVDLNSVMEVVISTLTEIISETGAEITFDNLPVIESNKTQMIQVLINLVKNAIKYHRPEERPRIRISVVPEKGFWLFSVADNGIGISQKYFNDIFRMFIQVNTTDKYPGDGIGLHIVKKIIEGHNGKIWLESEVGKGSTFFFTIPVSIKQ